MDRVATCLARLAPHVERAAVAITGSVALGGRPAGDLDLVAASRAVVARTVCEEFLVSHYHGGAKFIVQLVDPVTRLRVDVFPDRLGALATARPGQDGWRVVDLAVLFDHKLALLAGASPAAPIDPKHAVDARALAARLGRSAPAIDAGALRTDAYSTDLVARCARCDLGADPAFQLASKAAVFAILGYV